MRGKTAALSVSVRPECEAVIQCVTFNLCGKLDRVCVWDGAGGVRLPCSGSLPLDYFI